MIPDFFHILIIAASPIVELRGAIPVAITMYDFSPLAAFCLALIGNIIPPLVLIPCLGFVDKFFQERSEYWRRFFGTLLRRTRDNHEKKFELLKEFALVILVAIPLPLTGAWSASLAAYVFGIPFRKAIPLIFLGLIIAGAIVLGATVGVTTFFS